MKDVMRAEFNPITDRQKELATEVKAQFNAIYKLLEDIEYKLGPDRLMSIAKTELEGASMWAVKSITRDLKPVN